MTMGVPARYPRLVVDRATSRRLGQIRQQDTEPEQAVRGLLHRSGFRFRKRNRDLPGSPDAANRRRQWAVFVHGCFWHHHRGCPKATIPRHNRRFWLVKFEANVNRDRRCVRRLRALGYQCIVVWQCEVEGFPAEVATRLVQSLGHRLPPVVRIEVHPGVCSERP